MKRRLLCAVFLLVIAGSGWGASRPNILWIITDDHPADSTQAFNRAATGQDESKLGDVMSPNADRLVAEGVLFTRAYCNSPACAPSRTSMHYGMYPHHCGHYGFEQSHQSASFTKPTLPQLMNGRGYSTAMFGKSGYDIFQLQGERFVKSKLYDVDVGQKEFYKYGHTDWSKAKKWAKGQVTGTEIFWGFPDAPLRLFTPVDGPVSAELAERQQRVKKEQNLRYAYARANPTLVLLGDTRSNTVNASEQDATSNVDASSGQSNRKLSPEGVARKAAHDYLFGQFSSGKQLKFKGDAATRVLDEIVISTERMDVSGTFLLDLPDGAQRVASMFRYLILRGEGLDHLEGLVMLPYAPDSKMAISTRQPSIYRVKVPAMPIPSESMSPIQIRSRCKLGTSAVITEIAFNSQSKLSTIFDDIPYRNLGAEFPRETVDVKVDLANELSIRGHIDLEREKFCRYYAAPGNLDASFERWAAERHFLPGRQITKLQPALVNRHSKGQTKLTETSAGSGAADLSFFDRYNSAESISRTIKPFRHIRFAMCFNDYPEFMSVKQVGRGTPLIEHFDDAAELAAAYVADQIKDGGRTATWWEVKNESTIKAEWDYHWNKKYDSWALMADFHNRVADAVHRRSPLTKVGGPSSAWMQVQAADFGLYRNQIRFMDLTRDHVDFYSHHFYEDVGTLGAWERRSGRYTNYLLGRLEAILDMFRAHMYETDNVKPILVTECGSLQPGRGPSDYWLRIRSYSGYMHKLMQRPDQIDLVVPFAFLSIPWNPKSGDAAFIPKKGQPSNATLAGCDPTPVSKLFELWRDFDGRRLPVSFDRQWLDVTAVHKGKRLQLAITNMGGRRLLINVSSLAGKLSAKSVSQRRLYYRDGQVKYQDSVPHTDAAAIPVDVEETTIVTIELTRPLDIRGVVERTDCYAAGTALKSDVAFQQGYTLHVDDPASVQSATLVVGVQRSGGLGGSLSGTLNGERFNVDAGWANELNNLFAPISVAVPADVLAETNRVKIDARDGLTITSVHISTDRHRAP